MPKVYSMLSNDTVITITKKAESNKSVSKAVIEKAIIIKGGANVAIPKTSGKTERFVASDVTADELKQLQDHPVFKRMVDRGFITLKEPEQFKADKSAQLSEKEVKAKQPKAKVSTGPVDE